MRLAPLALATLLAAACTAPSQFSPSTYGTVRVAFGAPLDDAGPWRDDQLAELRAELVDLQGLGPAFAETSEGAADVVVRPFDSMAADPMGRACGAGVGRYHLGAAYVEVDAACAMGYDELRAAVGHEIGHWLHLRHIAAPDETCADCDPRVPAAYALMNPSISYDEDTGLMDDPTFTVAVATPVPTDADLLEFRLTR